MRAILDVVAIALIGDGMVAALIPTRHSRRYEAGPRPWRGVMRYFARRPALTRLLAVFEVALGIRLAFASR